MIVCADCGRENPDEARFCLACGARLQAAAPGREERKVVSILFADLVGFTSQAETLDPEDVRAMLSPYYARLRGELERRGGTVEKFIGDAVMAVFGAPVVHEDDPERAVRAGLAIRDAIVEDGQLQVRVAVTTGEALVSLDASQGEGMVAGDVVNTAARLQGSAPVNGVLVDETTQRATERAIEYREAEPVRAKGKAEPVRAWEAVEPRARFGVDVVQEGAAFVGRRRELDFLTDAFARAREQRDAQLVTLVGVPGIGKSRLVYELWRVIDAEEELVFWRQGRSLPYGRPPERSPRAAASRSASARRPWRRRGGRRRALRAVRRLARVLRGSGRGAADCARLRGPALGRRRPARLRRPPGRLEQRRPPARRLHGQA
jgi:class 3 adenylate cyclase